MANERHIKILEKGAEHWNKWRENNPDIVPDLSCIHMYQYKKPEPTLIKEGLFRGNQKRQPVKAIKNLCDADLSGVNLRNSVLYSVSLNDANMQNANLAGADLTGSKLAGANLISTNFSGAQLTHASMIDANLSSAFLRNADLHYVSAANSNFTGADLNGVDLTETDLTRSVFYKADLRQACLRGANLMGSNLNLADCHDASFEKAYIGRVHALETNFECANLTAACIEDWNINAKTNLDHVVCEHVYLSSKLELHMGYKALLYEERNPFSFKDRRPINSETSFSAGEFAALVAKLIDTIDLVFIDSIDWEAFFRSFQQLKDEYSEDSINVQSIERKGEAFIIKLTTNGLSSKASIEAKAKAFYEKQLQIIEAQYEQRLKLQDDYMGMVRLQMEADRREKATLIGIISSMAENQKGPTYYIQQSKFGGGFSTEGAIQSGGTLNDYSSTINKETDEIAQLIESIKDVVESFPLRQKEEALVDIEDLEDCVQTPEKHNKSRFRKRLKGLLAAGATAATLLGGTVKVSDELNQFTDNVISLGDKLGIQLESD